MQISIAAGGTGGHVYPATAIAEALAGLEPDARLTFIGSVGGFERPLVEASPVKFAQYIEVQSGPINGVGILRAGVSLVKLGIGTAQALVFMLRHRPDALLLTGGWVCVPGGIAAWMLRVPSMISLPDIEPALTIKALRHLATRVAVTAPDSLRYFRAGQAVVTGYPLRQALLTATRAAGIAHFGLDPARRTLLVFGGSRGARSINRAVAAILPELLADGVQLLWVTGKVDWDEVVGILKQQGLTADGERVKAFAYLHEDMALALASADLAVSRSGASVLGELTLFGLPSILVPYPYAWRYQKVNADYLVRQGAAVMVEDGRMSETLLPTIRQIMRDDVQRGAMGRASAALAQPQGAANAARELIRLANKER
ncbi:MAG: UDP-N-acetylglucosamine--N-acetylmuramyl-(pentapeptide) pyrophosphoryl-undecaprenol N-acetylglucosamine transferase [Anaerolineae bacterium]|nr:UDP-N-acetylglucosamine--N-acetylmuramyl-(pentapeptide) pyrophosphoryl-undecaprenol N-acetylglucosamine transferase [Anaerolineae bacterium]NUQ03985.1 UDP-N-acetylglucosamine--N-acetylmuramyl-(pentapeptide) pyrophosphoryl-undecaprenol N-acetylglucosamine transferase [Anaerolineae bacterium]